jgi:hypothetical protein
MEKAITKRTIIPFRIIEIFCDRSVRPIPIAAIMLAEKEKSKRYLIELKLIKVNGNTKATVIMSIPA